MFKVSNILNFLTILRIILIPGIIVCIEINEHFYSWIGLIFYILACFSDFLDGYIARKFDFESNLDDFDPIADKILVVALLIILLENGKISGFFVYPTLVIILREVIVSGLRDFFYIQVKV